MIAKLMLVQKVNENGDPEFFQAMSENVQWSFEYRRTKVIGDPEFFPFEFFGNPHIERPQPGAETKSYLKDDELIFYDDYGVPAGTAIGILFPENYVPDIIKFKDKPFIPSGLPGQFSTRPPGQIQVFYNRLEKRSAIVFHLHENILFGFKCIAKKIGKDEFPAHESTLADSLFDITLGREFLNVKSISDDNLKLINETLDKTDTDDLRNLLNELLNAVKAGQKQKSESLLNKIRGLLTDGTGMISGLITIADSYKAGGAAEQFIVRVLKYVSL